MGEQKLVYGKDDLLFGCIENQQADVPFGDVLDAGTGMHSLRWIATLGAKGMTSYTAITADATMQRNVQQEANHLGVLEGNHVVIGNWFGELDLPRQQYDVILADYLIGAMDGFSPYRQDEMIPKLMNLLKPGGRLYIVALEPIPDKTDGRANVICKVRQVRDACILLAGHRCYREYPADWIQSQIKSTPNLVIKETHKFPILYRFNTVQRQINVARSKLPLFATPALASSMKGVLDDLEQQAKKATSEGPFKFGFDYVISAEKEEEIAE
eukprot:CAMPEP_0119022302 /NCGR_PEP_ID=MMETSP1176-20130426/27667_1 /TAXON_ID=265551 /ORGANISM="Synedropsis recta cf, Strain CCMP1620" /LENGTH=269 /DNA_ID=CAMNT_0006977105 /DNA_START=192 /DNA_END=1001 /DNA_ORIENTATION=-